MKETGIIELGGATAIHVRWLLLIGLGALLLRLAPQVQHGTAWATFNPDSLDYLELAQGLNSGCGYARLAGGICSSPEALRLPGYPVFLAIMPSLRASLVSNGLLSAMVCLLAGLFSASAWDPRAGTIAALFVATDIPSIVLSAQVMSDPLFQLLLAAGFLGELSMFTGWGTARARRVVGISGLCSLAIATLVRPMGIALPFLAALPFVLRQTTIRKKLAGAMLAIAIVASPVAAWAFRNERTIGSFTYSTEGAVALYNYGAAGTIWWRSHENFETVKAGLNHEIGVADYSLTPAAMAPELIRRSIAIIRNDPVAFALISILSLGRISIAPEEYSLEVWFARPPSNVGHDPWFSTIAERARRLGADPAIAILLIFQMVLLAIVWWGVARSVLRWLRARDSDQKRLTLALLMLASTLLILGSTPGGTGARYRAMVFPFLAIIAASEWSSEERGSVIPS